ncbi:unnamed protein product [Amoebophrya sp. A120]|nr:unnamed protein product [Amoebophrya sp. A120]|eukprot:GSA120T00016452001.1
MADEEAPPPPNVVASASSTIRAPQAVVWTLIKDYASNPKLYDTGCSHDASLERDRVTRKPVKKQVKMSKPACVFEHTFEYDDRIEEDVPPPPAPPLEEGADESAEPVVPEPTGERWCRCEARFVVSKMGPTVAELADCNGTITVRVTEKTDALECELTTEVAVYSETLADSPPDFSVWADALAKNMKDYSEKMCYLAPKVAKMKSPAFTHTMLTKVKSFKFLSLKLSRSPSALDLLKSSEIGGSLGFYKDRQTSSPIPIGLSTRPHSVAA